MANIKATFEVTRHLTEEEEDRKAALQVHDPHADIPLAPIKPKPATWAKGSKLTDKNGEPIRKKGVRNKRSLEIIRSIEEACRLLGATMEEDIKALSPLKRMEMWCNLQEYLRPRLARVEQTGEGGGPLNHRHTIITRPHGTPGISGNAVNHNSIQEGEPHEAALLSHGDIVDEDGVGFAQTVVTHVNHETGSIVQHVATVRQLPLDCKVPEGETEVEIIS
jgi:hypothetical protein